MFSKKTKILFIIFLLIVPPIIIFLSRQFFSANYFFSSIYKIIFIFPLFYRLYIEKKSIKNSLFENFSLKLFKKNIISTILIGLALALIYISSFFIFRNFINFESITSKLNELISINFYSLLFIGLYIIIINSLLEEFFWRGFIFEKLSKYTTLGVAYIFTGFAFSFHHIMFYYNWFNLTFFIIVTLGLTVYAIIMNFIFQRYKDLFSCWVIHAFVDISQIFIAFKIFGFI